MKLLGYSGEDAPRMVTPSLAGVVESEGKKEYFVDDMLGIRRDKMAIAPLTDKQGCSILST
jgi:actin-related protein